MEKKDFVNGVKFTNNEVHENVHYEITNKSPEPNCLYILMYRHDRVKDAYKIEKVGDDYVIISTQVLGQPVTSSFFFSKWKVI